MIALEADPVEVFRFRATEQKKRVNRMRKPLGAASVAYLEYMERVGRNRSYIGHVRRALLDLEEEVGDLPVGEITTEQIRDYLFGLPYGAVTIRYKRNYYLGAFGWWQKQGWAEDNPAAAVPSPKVDLQEPGILTVEETIALFRAKKKVDSGICGLLALGAFAGMRTSAIKRLASEDIHFRNRAILISAAKAKKKRRQWIEGLPENLWSWLERTPAAAFFSFSWSSDPRLFCAYVLIRCVNL